MATYTMNESVLDAYWSQLCTLSDTLKLKLATKLTADVAERAEEKSNNVLGEADAEYTSHFIQRFAGRWGEPDEADKVIAMINADRRSKRGPIKID